MKKDDEFMAYIAGLMDGDGSFSIIKEKRSRGYVYSPCIQLSNVFKEMPMLLFNNFGGSFKEKSKQKHQKKVQYVWNVRGFSSCKSFLNKVKNFLVLKKERAFLLNEFIGKFSTDYEREIGKDGRFLPRDITDKGQSVYHMKLQCMNNDCLTNEFKLVKQTSKNSEDTIFWSYLAGILDTEGSFSIKKEKPSCGSRNFRYGTVIQLSMATIEVMNFIRKNICIGRICFPTAKTCQRGFCFKMSFNKVSECHFLISKVIPFLLFKKPAATMILEFCENYEVVKHCRNGIPKEEIEYRESIYQKVIQFNKYGYDKPSLIDSETLKQGYEGQAGNTMQAERLSERDTKVCATV